MPGAAVKGHEGTLALQQTALLFDHLAGKALGHRQRVHCVKCFDLCQRQKFQGMHSEMNKGANHERNKIFDHAQLS